MARGKRCGLMESRVGGGLWACEARDTFEAAGTVVQMDAEQWGLSMSVRLCALDRGNFGSWNRLMISRRRMCSGWIFRCWCLTGLG
jgi:hypothetical protein